jgi:CDP-glucose 4,6-dehydratase
MPEPGLTGEAFNFGTETPLSVLEVVDVLLGLMGRELEPTILNEATREIREQYLDCAKAKRVLGWEPRHTLEAGLRETIAWYEEWLGDAQTVEPLTVSPA